MKRFQWKLDIIDSLTKNVIYRNSIPSLADAVRPVFGSSTIPNRDAALSIITCHLHAPWQRIASRRNSSLSVKSTSKTDNKKKLYSHISPLTRTALRWCNLRRAVQKRAGTFLAFFSITNFRFLSRKNAITYSFSLHTSFLHINNQNINGSKNNFRYIKVNNLYCKILQHVAPSYCFLLSLRRNGCGQIAGNHTSNPPLLSRGFKNTRNGGSSSKNL
jgi:hypothetical protein